MPTESSASIDSADQHQLDKFKEAARDLGADEEEARWEERLRKVVKASPPLDTSPADK